MNGLVTITLTSLLLLWGCTNSTGRRDVPPADSGLDPMDPGRPILASPGPVVAGPIGAIEGFSIVPIAPGVTSPVTAITPDGRMHYAYLTGDYTWPVVGSMGDDVPVALPGEPMTTEAVTMIASADGTLHLAWDADRQIHYVRRYADGTFSEPVLLGDVPSREPNLALTSAGDVVLAWTYDTPPIDEVRRAPRVMVAVGAGEPVAFDAPRITNADCCVNDFGDVAERMSGPSLAVGPDDSIHVVYEWSNWSNTTIEYVQEEGLGFSAPVQISDAAFVPCPAVMVDEDGAHITYLREFEGSVFYRNVVDGVAGEEVTVFTPETGWSSMSMAVRDGDGVLHMGVTVDGGTEVLFYVRVPETGAAPEVTPIVEMAEAGGRVELTPRAGGILVAPDGRIVLSYQRLPVAAEAETWSEIAIGR